MWVSLIYNRSSHAMLPMLPIAGTQLDAVVLAPSSPINTEEYYKLWKNSQASYRSWASKGIDLSCAKAYESCTLSSNVGIFNI